MQEAYIIDYIRTPIGKFMGSLSGIRPDDMGALVIKELMKRNPQVDFEQTEDVLMGCANQAGEDNRNVARMSLLLSGLPFHVGGETVNRLCASGMAAVVNAARGIGTRQGSIYIAGGIENMTRAPLVISKPSMAFGRDARMYDSSFGWRFVNRELEKKWGTDPMGITAENLSKLKNISRKDQDNFALNSQIKTGKAQQSGRLAKEIVRVAIPRRKAAPLLFEQDEFVKPNSTMEGLAQLKPAFDKNGTVTAGNASGLNDGAAALLIMSKKAAKDFGYKPRVKILCAAVAGVEPRIMGIGPVQATKKVLARTNLSLADMDIIELNEAFAAQALACIRTWGIDDNDDRLNPNGGAIALGHPLGMSGARILGTAALELEKRNKKYALVTMCVGVGQGYAVILENET